MKKRLLLVLITVSSLNCYSQISFKKGYFIDNTEEKSDVLIRHVDWRSNPVTFEYKLSEESEIRSAGIDSIREFGVYNISKFIRAKVKIDRSSDNINKLSKIKEPILKEEELFLNLLVEGKANLFQYNDGPVRRYFFSKENSGIRQLVYKRYLIRSVKIGTNNSFRQQLWSELKCADLHIEEYDDIEYNREDLVKIFRRYNKCQDTEITFQPKEKKDLFNLNLRPRLNNSSMTIKNETTLSRDTDFGNKIAFGFGIEAEFILPFRNNKWSIIIEPSYQSFNQEKVTEESNVQGGTLVTRSKYQSIEGHFGFRHYFYLNDNSKIFLNASYVWDIESESSIEFYREGDNSLGSLDIATSNNLAFGLGYKYNNKYSLEIRFQNNREVLKSYRYYNSDYKTISLIVGYSIF